ncbi:MAG: radical SAM protein [Proteobacteria bacterium]|nr:radical SAM protein [Pseudomonadota bacterium]NIS68392.1 radical SAM protein [Pseudomonadota bacterium]
MKVALISPAIERQVSQKLKKTLAFFRSTLPYLAAFFPQDSDIRLIEESVEGPVEVARLVEDGVDFVGISPQTASATRGYEIAKNCKEMGLFVVMGGVHVSKVPYEALEYCDAVIIGEAENSLPALLTHYKRGQFNGFLRPQERIYKSEPLPELTNIPTPKWGFMKKALIDYATTVEIGRGCPYSCDFCSVHDLFGKRYRPRPVGEIVEELTALGAKRVLFSTDNLSANRSHVKELFSAVRSLGIEWMAEATMSFAQDSELVSLASKSGCKLIGIGFDSLSRNSLISVNKRFNEISQYYDCVSNLHDHGIAVGGSFIFGFDEDREGIAEETLEFSQKAKLDSVSAHILTPYPQTGIFKKFLKEGRLINADFPRDWSKYDTAHVVFLPRLMSPERLDAEYNTFKKEFFALSSIFQRSRYQERKTQDLLRYLAINLYYWYQS